MSNFEMHLECKGMLGFGRNGCFHVCITQNGMAGSASLVVRVPLISLPFDIKRIASQVVRQYRAALVVFIASLDWIPTEGAGLVLRVSIVLRGLNLAAGIVHVH